MNYGAKRVDGKGHQMGLRFIKTASKSRNGALNHQLERTKEGSQLYGSLLYFDRTLTESITYIIPYSLSRIAWFMGIP